MSTASVQVRVLVPDLDRLSKTLSDMRPVFAAVGMELLKEIGRNFEQEGVWAKWAPLRPNTMAGRRAGSSSKTLQASGRLRASFRSEATKDQVRVGSPLVIAKYHEEGRGEPVGDPGWTIRPKKGKALAFVVATGGQSLKRGKFKSYGYAKRSAKFMGKANFAVVASVHHPGYPARKMLPHPSRALTISRAVAMKFLGGAK